MTPDHSALIERLENECCNCGYAGLMHEAYEALRDLTEWRDIATAPKDRTPILARIHDDLFPRIVGEGRSDLERWNGQRVAVHHPGLCEDGFDLGWGVSAPVGVGLGRDDWFAGWLPLPSAPNQAKEAGE